MAGVAPEISMGKENKENTPVTRKEKSQGFWQSKKRKRKDEEVQKNKLNFEKKRIKQKVDNSQFDIIPMNGISVKLPCGIQPYPAQKLIMVRILMALGKMQNVIVESPTGSGKTLALLASTCAWLTKHKENYTLSKTQCQLHGLQKLDTSVQTITNFEDTENNESDVSLVNSYETELHDDFIKPSPSIPVGQKGTPKLAQPACTCLPRVRIYYGTRTHKQIGQVVKEFKRLPYAGVIRHTILASREQYCINEQARRSRDITSHCRDLLTNDGLGCPYKTNIRSNRLENPYLMRKHVETHAETVFDVEDLVEALKDAKPTVCPYFTSTRILTSDADIIFTPFSYLVDPIIRESSDVKVKNSIIILDEAHNIEDTCREGASFTFTEHEIGNAVQNFKSKNNELKDILSQKLPAFESDATEKLRQYSQNINKLTHFVENIWEWLKSEAETVKAVPMDTFTKQQTITKGWSEMSASLLPNEEEITSGKGKLVFEKNSKEYEDLLGALMGLSTPDENDKFLNKFKPDGTSMIMLEKWLYFCRFFAVGQNKRTYRMHICAEKNTMSSGHSTYSEFKSPGQGPKNVYYSKAESFWNDSRSGLQSIIPGSTTSISMWCMNPALTFMDAFAESRSVILASGTLCPLESLKTELGTKFPTEIEGKQVIPNDRIFASVVAAGPSGLPLTITQSKCNSNPKILHDVAVIIKDICLTVPRGILCFCTSYKMMDTIMRLIQGDTAAQSITRKKIIFEEPRYSAGMNDVMQRFDDVLNFPRRYGPEIDGALLLAVFRGKISEGIDFTDDKARVVITIGIPYPNFGDHQVIEKRKYNSENAASLKIINGDSWYATQAYRALNQALGRCLRHKNDWGALVLIDDRLVNQATHYALQKVDDKTNSSTKVSKWIRDQLQVFFDYNSFLPSLKQFLLTMDEDVIPNTGADRHIATSIS